MASLMQVFYILFASAFVINFIYFFFLRRLFNLLKNRCPDKFKELGEPSLWWNNSPRNGIRVLRFISSKDPLFSQDKELLTTKNFAVIFLCAEIGIFILLLVIFFLFFVNGYQQVKGG